MPSIRRNALPYALGVLTLALTGCFGDGGGGNASTETPAAPLSISVLSSSPDRVTGGDMRVLVESNAGPLQPDVRVLVNEVELMDSVALEERDGGLSGVLSGLSPGANQVVVEARTVDGKELRTEVSVVNHPITGPVFSGPHLTPFECRTVESGLGMPLDDQCSVDTRVDYFYFNQNGDRQPLTDPYGPRPTDIATTTTLSGETVPHIVRVESGTINRSIYRIAVLEDHRPKVSGMTLPGTGDWCSAWVNQRRLNTIRATTILMRYSRTLPAGARSRRATVTSYPRLT